MLAPISLPISGGSSSTGSQGSPTSNGGSNSTSGTPSSTATAGSSSAGGSQGVATQGSGSDSTFLVASSVTKPSGDRQDVQASRGMATQLLDALAQLAGEVSAGMSGPAGSVTASGDASVGRPADLKLARTVESYFDF